MYQDKFIDLVNDELNFYNIYDKLGTPSSELELILIGGIIREHAAVGCIGFVTEDKSLVNGKTLRYDFGLVNRVKHNVQNIFCRLEGNGSPHFWKSFDQSQEEFNTYVKDFYNKMITSVVPVVNINMGILGSGFEKNKLRRKAYVKLVESGILRKAIKDAITYRRVVNVNLRDSDAVPCPTKTGNGVVDSYLLNMITRPDYVVKV